MNQRPWAAFCISTFKRPEFLKKQLSSLLKQTYENYEIIISDNDPLASGRDIALAFEDNRIKYFHNGENLGMIRSFNKSIERSIADYIVMVTDDDPVENMFLSEMYKLESGSPGYSLYAGFTRNTSPGRVEVINAPDFIAEILDPRKTPWMLWSSAILKRNDVTGIDMIPDYGSPHLADHALIAMVGSINGGVIMNRKFSSLTSHESNFSKLNFEYYTLGCKGFYTVMDKFCNDHKVSVKSRRTIIKHLEWWFVANIFNLRRYYSVRKPDKSVLERIDFCAREILSFPFMKRSIFRYKLKELVFVIKRSIGLLK